MSFIGDLLGTGSIPKLPAWKPLDLGTEAATANKTNQANQAGAAATATASSKFILDLMQEADPNFNAIRGQESQNILDASRGVLPKDVQDLISNKANAQALGQGVGASGGYKGDLTLRDLGLTSLDRMDKSLGMAESWMAQSERLMSPAIHQYDSMFITPEQQAQFDVNERNSKFAHDYLGEQLSAMPPPDHPFAVISGLLGGGRGQQGMPAFNFGGGGGGGGSSPDTTWGSGSTGPYNVDYGFGASDASTSDMFAADAANSGTAADVIGAGF